MELKKTVGFVVNAKTDFIFSATVFGLSQATLVLAPLCNFCVNVQGEVANSIISGINIDTFCSNSSSSWWRGPNCEPLSNQTSSHFKLEHDQAHVAVHLLVFRSFMHFVRVRILLAVGRWFPPGTPVSSTRKTDFITISPP